MALAVVQLVDRLWHQQAGCWGWLLADPRQLRKPFLVSGRLGLYPVRLPAGSV
jgi:hypothetical protein